MQRVNSLENTLMLGKIEGKRRRVKQRLRWLDSIANWVDMNFSELWEIVEEEEPGTLLSSILKSRGITWLTKVYMIKSLYVVVVQVM